MKLEIFRNCNYFERISLWIFKSITQLNSIGTFLANKTSSIQWSHEIPLAVYNKPVLLYILNTYNISYLHFKVYKLKISKCQILSHFHILCWGPSRGYLIPQNQPKLVAYLERHLKL